MLRIYWVCVCVFFFRCVIESTCCLFITNIEFIIHLKRVCIIYTHPHLFGFFFFYIHSLAIGFGTLYGFIQWILIQCVCYNTTTTKNIFPFISFHVFIVGIVILQYLPSFFAVTYHKSGIQLYGNREFRLFFPEGNCWKIRIK